MSKFVTAQRLAQGAWFDRHQAGRNGYKGSAYRLAPKDRLHNLTPAVQERAAALFDAAGIQWHQHASHGLSSQVCCLNFLMPFADNPPALARWVTHVTGDQVAEMLPVETIGGRDWFVTFEWIGDTDHLNEAPPGTTRKRGANATASDAAVKYRDADDRVQLLLIEWKYSEKYSGKVDPAGHGTRRDRYEKIWRAPNGPIRSDAPVSLDDFFYEPFYQLLRQQMLAFHTERAGNGIDRVRVLHLSPSGNEALHKVTPPKFRELGKDAFKVFEGLLADPDAFIGSTIEDAFAPLAGWADADWWPWLSERYAFLTEAG